MDERGFTLIELLVVILIIGILAAIALPMFIAQASKADDATVKSDLRNAVTQMESCFTAPERYTGCPDGDHPVAPGVGVDVAPSGLAYTVSKTSDTTTVFSIARSGAGNTRGCTQPGVGGCNALGGW